MGLNLSCSLPIKIIFWEHPNSQLSYGEFQGHKFIFRLSIFSTLPVFYPYFHLYGFVRLLVVCSHNHGHIQSFIIRSHKL